MNAGRSLTATLLLVFGALWICLTGACCEAVFKGMRDADKLPLVLLCTLPGCVLALAGGAMLLTRPAAGLVILAYAALLSFTWSGAVLGSNAGHPNGMVTLLAVFNVPPAGLAIWGLALVLRRGDDRAA